MFVYFGKLTWESPKIVDESFVIVLPNGPVRVGDTAYLFTQWTNGSRGVKKSNWFQNLAVESVTKNKNGDDTFYLNHHSLSYVIKSQDVYSKLSATITKGHSKSSTSLQRIYEPHGEENTGSVRIWTGKFNWLRFAVNEMAIFITPEGFGEGKPVISLWQFTEDSAGKKKDPSPRIATQKMESGPDGTVKFSYNSYYDITCTWDKQTEHLAVQLSFYSPGTSDAINKRTPVGLYYFDDRGYVVWRETAGSSSMEEQRSYCYSVYHCYYQHQSLTGLETLFP